MIKHVKFIHFSIYCKNLSYFQILDFLNLGFHSFEQICVHYLWIVFPFLKNDVNTSKDIKKVFIQSCSSSFLCVYWNSCKHENWNLPFDTLYCGSNFSHMHLSLKRKSAVLRVRRWSCCCSESWDHTSRGKMAALKTDFFLFCWL